MILMLALCLAALGLTVAMFATRNMMLGFPSAIFWGIFGGYAYQQSSSTWDWQYILFFSAMGMTIFSLLAAYALRNRDMAGPDMDRGKFIDEGGRKGKKTASAESIDDEEEKVWGDLDRMDVFATEDNVTGRRAREIRERAKERKKKIKWGEFK